MLGEHSFGDVEYPLLGINYHTNDSIIRLTHSSTQYCLMPSLREFRKLNAAENRLCSRSRYLRARRISSGGCSLLKGGSRCSKSLMRLELSPDLGLHGAAQKGAAQRQPCVPLPEAFPIRIVMIATAWRRTALDHRVRTRTLLFVCCREHELTRHVAEGKEKLLSESPYGLLEKCRSARPWEE